MLRRCSSGGQVRLLPLHRSTDRCLRSLFWTGACAAAGLTAFRGGWWAQRSEMGGWQQMGKSLSFPLDFTPGPGVQREQPSHWWAKKKKKWLHHSPGSGCKSDCHMGLISCTLFYITGAPSILITHKGTSDVLVLRRRRCCRSSLSITKPQQSYHELTMHRLQVS